MVGCGTGLSVTELGQQLVATGVPFSMLCIDVSSASLEIARARVTSARLSELMVIQRDRPNMQHSIIRLLSNPADPLPYEQLSLSGANAGSVGPRTRHLLAAWRFVAPGSPVAYLRFSRMLMADGAAAKASRIIDLGIALCPNPGVLIRELAGRIRSENPARAHDLARQAILFNPSDGQGFIVLFAIYNNTDDTKVTIDSAKRAIVCLDPVRQGFDLSNTVLRLTGKQRSSGASRVALSLLKNYRALFAKHGLADKHLLERAIHQLLVGEYDASSRSFQKLMTLTGARYRAETLSYLTILHYARGDRDAYANLVRPNFLWHSEIRSLFKGGDFERFNDHLGQHIQRLTTLQVARDGSQGAIYRTPYSGPESLLHDEDRAVENLIRALLQRAREYRARLPYEADHPFLRHRDESLRLGRLWGLVINGTVEPNTHHHGDSFITSVYYANTPVDTTGADKAGWLEIGRPDLAIDFEESDVSYIQPQVGDLIFIPSHIFHRPISCTVSEPRISIASDFFLKEAASLDR